MAPKNAGRKVVICRNRKTNRNTNIKKNDICLRRCGFTRLPVAIT
jgi:hypothetical protein